MGKTRKELRKKITKSVSRIESDIFLGMLLQISEIFRKPFDDEECEEMSDLQWNQRSVIRDVLSMHNAEDVSFIIMLIDSIKWVDLQNKQIAGEGNHDTREV